MFRKSLSILLAFFVLTFSGYPILYVSGSESEDHGPHDKLNHAIRLEGNAKEDCQREYDKHQDINTLLTGLSVAYAAKSAAITKGKIVTIAAGVGAITSAVLTGGVAAPTVAGIIGAAAALGVSLNGESNLLIAYNDALNMKIAQNDVLREAIRKYNDVYHNKYLRERSNHFAAVMRHNNTDHKPVITKWHRTPHYDLPEFTCGGKCGQTFNSPLGDHGDVCGSGRRKLDSLGYSVVDESVPPGCFELWYSCDPSAVKKHTPVACTLSIKVYRQLIGEKKELRATKDCPSQFRPCQKFPLGYHDEIHHGFINASGRFQYSRFPTHITYDRMIKHQHNPDEEAEASTPDTPESPVLHVCGVHESWQSGDHSYTTPACGTSSHAGYACQISSDHTTTVSGYSGAFYECQSHKTYACGHTDLSTNASKHVQTYCYETDDNGKTCEVGNYYKCQSHKCVFPIACGARSWTNCMANVSSRTQHQTTCPAGHLYWSCSSGGVAAHATPITCKRPGCSVTIMKCQNTGSGGCFSNGTEYRYHKLQ